MHERMDYLTLSSSVRIHSMSLLVYDFSVTSSIQWPTIFLMAFVHTGFLCQGDELNTTIIRTMPGTRPKAFTTNALPFLCVCFGWQLNDTTGRLTRPERKEIVR